MFPILNIFILKFALGTPVYNFALAKVRLQGLTGATNARAFFRLFSYTATNLIFDDNTAYRFASSGSTKIPLQGMHLFPCIFLSFA